MSHKFQHGARRGCVLKQRGKVGFCRFDARLSQQAEVVQRFYLPFVATYIERYSVSQDPSNWIQRDIPALIAKGE